MGLEMALETWDVELLAIVCCRNENLELVLSKITFGKKSKKERASNFLEALQKFAA
jgi:hypothetical protein